MLHKLRWLSVHGICVVSIIVALFISSCEEPPPPPPAPSKVEKTEPPPPKEDANKKNEPRYTYDASGRREPFKSLLSEEVEAVEDVIVTPPPDEITSPLQKFEISELKLTGIILGGLGDYAVVDAPDGKTYTIDVGTAVGIHRGKVLSISDNSIVIKETILYESGNEDIVETEIHLNPIEEGEKP